MKLTFKFKEYTPIEINIKDEDVDNLNIILSYLNMGAKTQCMDNNGEYFMDMSFEDKPISIKEWFKIKWFLFKNRWFNE